MSWSINATGKPADVIRAANEQAAGFRFSDAGENDTLNNVRQTIVQTVGTFDPDKIVRVDAAGSMAFDDWGTKTGPSQYVSLKIEAIHITAKPGTGTPVKAA